ncbi:MAG: nitrile hydratase subunit alpha [Rhodospirillaceae bacterium]
MSTHHDHEHPGHDHARTFQPDIEDSPFTHYQVMAQALGDLLIEKNVFTADELRRQIEIQDTRTPAEGAKLVARAWVDGGFAAWLARDVNAAAESIGIPAGDIPIRALFDTPSLHNVIVCTLCSCYPRQLIGLPPAWYKSREYRSRMVREPRSVLAEFGTTLPDDMELRVHDSTADQRYMVVPLRPAGTEDWDQARLAQIVTRDCLIGVTLPRASAQ